MDGTVIPPTSGAGELTPKEFTKKFFEFFRVGTRREVLLLGEVIDYPVHYVKSKGHKVLCRSRVATCALCEMALESEDVETRQMEYCAPSFVRVWSEREFHQKVVVFSAAARQRIRTLVPDDAARGQRLEVQSKSQGTSARYLISALPGLPREFPAVIPAAFDVVPFIRGRYGKSQEPGREPVFLPSFKCEAVRPMSAGSVRDLDLTAADCAPDPEELARLKAMIAARLKGYDDPGAAVATPTPDAPPPTPLAATAAPPVANTKEVTFRVALPDPDAVARNLAERKAADDARRASLKLAADPSAIIDQTLDVLSATFTPPGGRRPQAPGLNGKHAGKNGGAL